MVHDSAAKNLVTLFHSPTMSFCFHSSRRQEGNPWSEVGNFMSFSLSYLFCRKQGRIEKKWKTMVISALDYESLFSNTKRAHRLYLRAQQQQHQLHTCLACLIDFSPSRTLFFFFFAISNICHLFVSIASANLLVLTASCWSQPGGVCSRRKEVQCFS